MTAEIAIQNIDGLLEDCNSSLQHIENLEKHFRNPMNGDEWFAIIEGTKSNLKSNKYNIEQLRNQVKP